MATSKAKRLGAAAALATAIAVPAEGLRQYAYYDPPGILTVCYGHTGPDVIKGVRYTLDQCQALLTEDMREAINAVEQCQPELPVTVLAAFSDAAFNIGPTVACDRSRSTAARLLASKDYRAACEQLPRWNKARVMGVMVELPGLTKRRAAERELCLKGLA
jgi:GH24 family phage-related lysozyme (muramidase)